MTNSSVCIDVDECKNEPCDVNANCANEPGNFSCTCSFGYSGDGVTCSKMSILVMSTYNKMKTSLLVNAKGQSNVNMTIGSRDGPKGTEVFMSCSVTFRNRFYIFGGMEQHQQISEVTQCELRRIGTLDFRLWGGTCSNVDNREIYLCFSKDYNSIDGTKQCRSAVDPLGYFTEIALSKYNHLDCRTAASPSKF